MKTCNEKIDCCHHLTFGDVNNSRKKREVNLDLILGSKFISLFRLFNSMMIFFYLGPFLPKRMLNLLVARFRNNRIMWVHFHF